MSKNKTKKNVAYFNLVGQLMGFILKDGYKVKYLRLEVANREYWVKITKELRQTITESFQEGNYLKIKGEYTQDYKTRKTKLKADVIELVPAQETYFTFEQPEKSKKPTILICQKANCWKGGGKAIYEQITNYLANKGLEEQVNIKCTGCLKKCKRKPNLVFMPDRTHYSKITTKEVNSLLEKHIVPNLKVKTVS